MEDSVETDTILVWFAFVYDILQNLMTHITDPTDEILELLEDIYPLLRETNQKVDELTDLVEELMRNMEQSYDMTRIVAAFSDSVRRLDYLMLFVNDESNFDETNQVIIDTPSIEWAEAVLSQSDDGIGPVLFDMHEMITGSFGTVPICDVYMNGLLVPLNPDIWLEMDRLVETLIEMQKSGYSNWGIGLDILERSSEKPAVEDLMEERLLAQEPYFVVDVRHQTWPQSQYGLVQAATGCPSGSWSAGARYHDT